MASYGCQKGAERALSSEASLIAAGVGWTFCFLGTLIGTSLEKGNKLCPIFRKSYILAFVLHKELEDKDIEKRVDLPFNQNTLFIRELINHRLLWEYYCLLL